MTVQELIEILQKADPQAEVRIVHPYLNDNAEVDHVALLGPANNIPFIDARWN